MMMRLLRLLCCLWILLLIRATRRHLPEDDNHHSHRRGNLKSYKPQNLPPYQLWIPEPICMKLVMYIVAPESNSAVYFINPSHQSVCLYVVVARQRLGKNVTATTNTHATIKNCWTRRFLCGTCRINRKQAISSCQTFLFHIYFSRSFPVHGVVTSIFRWQSWYLQFSFRTRQSVD
jgi:hypothetical protein